MQQAFYDLVDKLSASLSGDEVLLANLSGEHSDFVRFSRSRVRQAGSVSQAYLSLELIDGRRHVSGTLTLTGDASSDRERAAAELAELRGRVASVPEDPYLLYNTEPARTQQTRAGSAGDSADMLEAALAAGEGLDMVGIIAAGDIYAAFANSLGQRNWFATQSFHLDWSFYHAADKAVKCSYAGFEWDRAAFDEKVADAKRQLDVLSQPAKTIQPGRYRVYLAPAAMGEVMTMLCYGGFGLKARRTKTTSLLKMAEADRRLAESVTIREDTAEGIAPNFQAAGFLRPSAVTLISQGSLGDALVSPRSAKEYGVETNGADAAEMPQSLDMPGGDLADEQVLERLGTGVYVNRLWYLNYSDRPACRMTGMTRFATFWVESGRIAAPLNVMRFDETIYNMLGENLIGLTRGREFLPSNSTYGARSTDSMRLPGALIDNLAFTL